MLDRTGLLSGIRTQAVVGGNLPEMIAQVAARYGAIMHRRIDPGACHCHGGQGNCVGCEPIPIHKHFQRAPALDGEDGQPGTPIMTSLHAGADGFAGSATIVVYNENEETQTYTSIYRLELIDFDVEDENGDGIFEPGEHLFIRRIRVRNTGESSCICQMETQKYWRVTLHKAECHRPGGQSQYQWFLQTGSAPSKAQLEQLSSHRQSLRKPLLLSRDRLKSLFDQTGIIQSQGCSLFVANASP